VASDLATGAAQVMTSMAHYPALLRASPWELEEETKDRETIPCARNLGLAAEIQPESPAAMASAEGNACTTHDKPLQRTGPA